MLVLGRKDGQLVEIRHRSGDVIRLRVYDVQGPTPEGRAGRLRIAFDDDARNFDISRPGEQWRGRTHGNTNT